MNLYSSILKSIVAVGGCALFTFGANAYSFPAGTKTDSFIEINVTDIQRTDDGNITVDLSLDLEKVDMKSNIETVYTPMLVNGADTVRMSSFSIAGRNRMYWDRRNDALLPVTFYKNELVSDPAATNFSQNGAISVKPVSTNIRNTKNNKINNYTVRLTAPYKDWMETAYFTIDINTLGCANCLKDNPNGVDYYTLAQTDFVQRSYFPEFLYVTPVAEAVKMREISARAYIDFPVNRIEIYPDYRRNPEELAKIRATIDSVRNDKDINITSLHISGTASPEGGYQNNIRLAKGRTEALKDYVQSLYRFPTGLITTSFEPVDWKGLADFLEMVVDLNYSRIGANGPGVPLRVKEGQDSIRFDQFQNINFDPATINDILPDASKILDIVNSNIEPFERNNKIKFSYKDQYAWLLENVYPALRHSDYRIQFEIKTYTEVEEILEVMATRPQNLSLAELFVAASSQEPGSPLYNRAFELAVDMYPEDEAANLNAATAAMQRGDLISAQRFLSKVTQETPEADYARAMMLLMQGQQEEALNLFRSLANSLNPQVAAKASAAVQGFEEINKANARRFIPVE